MTNREKYIDGKTNEEIADAICRIGLNYRYSIDTQRKIELWLSQEVENDK